MVKMPVFIESFIAESHAAEPYIEPYSEYLGFSILVMVAPTPHTLLSSPLSRTGDS
jgi:hypothetical protein